MSAYLSVRQVSERLGVSRSLVYREMRNGSLPFHKFGRRTYRIAEEDVAAYASATKSSAIAAGSASPVREPCPKNGQFRHLNVSRLLS